MWGKSKRGRKCVKRNTILKVKETKKNKRKNKQRKERRNKGRNKSLKEGHIYKKKREKDEESKQSTEG
jgi:hypothetical protein